MLKKFKFLWIALGFIAVERFCYVQTAGFRLSKTHSDFVYESSCSNEEMEAPALFDQVYTFLGTGVQCYAFLSEDGKTVLKLFKHYHNMPIEGFFKELPLPALLHKWRAHLLSRREARLRSIFSSCEIAAQEWREETGLLFLHLKPTRFLNKKVTLIDKLGIAHEIDLDTSAFLLQKKAEMLADKLERMKKNKDYTSMKECLHSLSSLITQRCNKGIANSDLRLERNIGFIENRALEIDLGSFQRMAGAESVREVEREKERLKHFLKNHYPEYVEKKSL
ncbi:MAG: hypothetical protein ACHQT8_07740 [Chlamydiales bacterium]